MTHSEGSPLSCVRRLISRGPSVGWPAAMGRKLGRLGVSVGLGLTVITTDARSQSFPHSVTNGWADLRPAAVLVADEAASRRGRELLERVARRQGLDAWRDHATLEVVGVDRWSEPGPWWPAKDQRLRMQQLIDTFTSRVELLDGPAKGEVWGLQSWSAYRRSNVQSPAEFLTEPNGTMEFYLPTLQYFNELVFRLLKATTIIDAGPAELGGRTYQRVFVSWDNPEPRGEVDHYVLWIGDESSLLEKAHYTVRDLASKDLVPEEQKPMMRAGAVGTVHFTDFRGRGWGSFPVSSGRDAVRPGAGRRSPRDGLRACLRRGVGEVR